MNVQDGGEPEQQALHLKTKLRQNKQMEILKNTFSVYLRRTCECFSNYLGAGDTAQRFRSLLLQRTWVQLPAPKWWLQPPVTPVRGDSVPFLAPRAPVARGAGTCIQANMDAHAIK